MPKTVQPWPRAAHRVEQAGAAHGLRDLVGPGAVQDGQRWAVRQEDVDGGPGGYGVRGVRRVVSVFAALVGEGPLAEFGGVGRGVDLGRRKGVSEVRRVGGS